MFVVSRNKRRSKADNQTDKNCMLQTVRCRPRETYTAQLLPGLLPIDLTSMYHHQYQTEAGHYCTHVQLPTLYRTATEITSQDPNYLFL